MRKRQVTLRIGWSSWWSLLALALAVYIIIPYVPIVLTTAGILFITFMMTLVIAPLADSLQRWRIPRWLTVLGVYAVVGGTIAMIIMMSLPIISANITFIQRHGSDLMTNMQEQVADVPLLGEWVEELGSASGFGIQDIIQPMDTLFQTTMQTVASTGTLLVYALLVIVLTFFFVTDTRLGPSIRREWVPERFRDSTDLIVQRLRQRLGRWVLAQLGVTAYFVVCYWVGLALLGVPFWFTIGLIGGILEIVPYVGGAIGLLLAVLSALTVDPWVAVWVVVMHTVVVLIEGHIIDPALFGRAVGIHPAAILLALFVGAQVGGMVGIFFAVPVAVVILVLVQEVRAIRAAGREKQVEDGSSEGA